MLPFLYRPLHSREWSQGYSRPDQEALHQHLWLPWQSLCGEQRKRCGVWWDQLEVVVAHVLFTSSILHPLLTLLYFSLVFDKITTRSKGKTTRSAEYSDAATSFCYFTFIKNWRGEQSPLVIPASGSLDLEDLHGVGGLTGSKRDQQRPRQYQLPPNSIGKTQVLGQRAAEVKNRLLAFLY